MVKLDNAGDVPGELRCGRRLLQADSSGSGAPGPSMLLLLGCTRQKAEMPQNPLTWDDCLDPERLRLRTEELKGQLRPARDMFTSPLFLEAIEAAQTLRGTFGQDAVGVVIVSAAYGAIPEDREIAPYDVSFGDVSLEEARWRGEHLGLPAAVRQVSAGYPLVLSLLGRGYRAAADLPGDEPLPGKRIYLTGAAGLGWLPEGSSQVRLGAAEMEAFGAGPMTVKAKVLQHFAKGLVRGGAVAFGEVLEHTGAEGFLRVALAGRDG